jgi:hypothetical protein
MAAEQGPVDTSVASVDVGEFSLSAAVSKIN